MEGFACGRQLIQYISSVKGLFSAKTLNPNAKMQIRRGSKSVHGTYLGSTVYMRGKVSSHTSGLRE